MAGLCVPGLVHFLCFSGVVLFAEASSELFGAADEEAADLGRLKRRVRRVQDEGRYHLSGAAPGWYDSPVSRLSLNRHFSDAAQLVV